MRITSPFARALSRQTSPETCRWVKLFLAYLSHLCYSNACNAAGMNYSTISTRFRGRKWWIHTAFGAGQDTCSPVPSESMVSKLTVFVQWFELEMVRPAINGCSALAWSDRGLIKVCNEKGPGGSPKLPGGWCVDTQSCLAHLTNLRLTIPWYCYSYSLSMFPPIGTEHLSTYMKIYKVGDIVDVKVCWWSLIRIATDVGIMAGRSSFQCHGAFHKGMPHKFYHGKTGRVYNVTKRAVGVIVNKQVRWVCVSIHNPPQEALGDLSRVVIHCENEFIWRHMYKFS